MHSVTITSIAIVIAYIVKSVLGFGHAMITVPGLSLIFSVQDAIIISALGDLVCNGILLYKERKSIKTSILKKIGPSLFIGAFIGVSIITNVNEPLLKKIMGGLILTYLIIHTFKPQIKLEKKWKKNVLGWTMGLIGGITGGLINTNGPAIYIYLNSVSMKKEVIKANLIIVFFSDCLWRTGLYASKGVMSTESLLMFGAFFLPLMIIGLVIGNKVDKLINSKNYTIISKGLMALTAVRMIF